MNTEQNQTPPVVPVRRRLVERHPIVRPSTRQEMVRAYNAAYRENLEKSGTPDRRQLAEAVLQAAIIEALSSEPEGGKRLLRAAAAILRSIVTEKDKLAFSVEGIRARIGVVMNSMNVMPNP